MDVSVVVPAKDAAATLPALLDALAAQDYAGAFEIVLVDDGSSDATRSLASAAGVRVVDGAGDGPAQARNAGVAASVGAVLAFTDADCAPEPGWLTAGMAAMEDTDLVQGMVDAPAGVSCGPWDRSISILRPSGLFETANLFVRRPLFEAIGGFESWLGTQTDKELAEDVWLGWRAVRSGARVDFCAEALVRHAVFPRGPRGYIGERLRLRFFPAMARRIPELREQLLFRRFFLTARQARFDLAVAGLAAATGARRPVLAAAALPYGLLAARDARARGVRVAAVDIGADAVSLAALAYGSVGARSLLL